MDKIAKALQNLLPKEWEAFKVILSNIQVDVWGGLDLKKLKNCDDIFRVRKGKLRIIFKKKADGGYSILAIERRSDKTYNY